MVLEKVYNVVKDINTEVENIEYGGCGVFALNMYKVLKQLGYKPKLVCITRTKENIQYWLEGNRDPFNTMFINVQHIVVELDKTYIDNNGVYKRIAAIKHCDDYDLKVIKLKPNDVSTWVNEWQWNHKFKRASIPTIEKRLEDCYKKLEKDLAVSK